MEVSCPARAEDHTDSKVVAQPQIEVSYARNWHCFINRAYFGVSWLTWIGSLLAASGFSSSMTKAGGWWGTEPSSRLCNLLASLRSALLANPASTWHSVSYFYSVSGGPLSGKGCLGHELKMIAFSWSTASCKSEVLLVPDKSTQDPGLLSVVGLDWMYTGSFSALRIWKKGWG